MSVRDDYAGKTIASLEDWQQLEQALLGEVKEQVAGAGLSFVKNLPNTFKFGAVVANAEGTKWIHITTADVREEEGWPDKISLRRMSSERDWKGDTFHYCALEELSAALTEYMGDSYDDEIL